jgi:hypothetical protein
MGESQVNHHFVGLIFSLHSSAWIHLGKVANPATGKTERNLEAAREVIDLLGALDEKTRGNRVDDEDKLMNQILTELRMNYVDELERSKSEATDAGSDAAPNAGAEAAAASDADSGAEKKPDAGAEKKPDAADAVAADTVSSEDEDRDKGD